MKKLTRSGWQPFETPPGVAQAFVKASRDYFAETAIRAARRKQMNEAAN